MEWPLFIMLLGKVLNKLWKFLLNTDPTLIFKKKFSFSFSFFFKIFFCCNTVDLLDCDGGGWVVGMRGWWRGLEWFFLKKNFLFLFFYCVRMGKQFLMLQEIRILLNWSSNWRFFFISLSSFFFLTFSLFLSVFDLFLVEVE